jgi:hypothetical protein
LDALPASLEHGIQESKFTRKIHSLTLSFIHEIIIIWIADPFAVPVVLHLRLVPQFLVCPGESRPAHHAFIWQMIIAAEFMNNDQRSAGSSWQK